MSHSHPLIRAIAIVGGTRLADALNVTPQWISKMKKRAQLDPTYRMPAEHVMKTEAETGGQVTRHELRPDIYPIEPSVYGSKVIDHGPQERQVQLAGGGRWPE